jgi:hypothetical protein
VQIYRALVGLYPRTFRERYRDDMVVLFCEQLRDESPWRVSTRAAVDLSITIPTQYSEEYMHRAPRAFVPLLYAGIALAGVLLAVVGGSIAATAIVGISTAAVAATLGVMSWRRLAPVADEKSHGSASGKWWKFVGVGAALIGAVIIGSGIGINAWNLGLLAVFTGVTFVGIGLLLGGLRVVQLVSGSRT